ncbi:MAG: hypothetical protein M1828_002305 [Chrysothrix sp. TS-e1954]|nr:MAG: hypothetical protein M1828_002305 [Chrysothrix sp. TS-e1954]
MTSHGVKRPTASDSSSSKKPRFDYRNPSTLAADAPEEEDTILDLDEIGKGGAQAKRKAVKLEGYESDSSNENFDARADAKARELKRQEKAEEKSKDEEDNDMFADLDEKEADGDEDEDIAREGKKRKKEVTFMNDNEIDGQVQNSKSGGHVSADFSIGPKKARGTREVESSSDEGGDDEERDRIGEDLDEELGAGSKKKHAPKLDAFNMRDEAEEGRFDDKGNFVRKAADPLAVHDSWLEGATKAEVKKAAKAHEQREVDRRKRDMADDAVPTENVLGALISRLELSETVLEAIARLGAGKTNKKPKWQKNKRKGAMEVETDVDASEADSADTMRREAVEAVTAAADHLMTRGQIDIYDTQREKLMRQYRQETGHDWTDGSTVDVDSEMSEKTKEWEYRWSDSRDGGEKHGPYDANTMVAWNEAGYFGEGVEFRQVGTEGTWSRSVDFV